MEGNRTLRIVLICAVAIGRTRGEYDEVWRRRFEETRRAAQEAYQSDPLQVTADFNHHVHLYESLTVSGINMFESYILFSSA